MNQSTLEEFTTATYFAPHIVHESWIEKEIEPGCIDLYIVNVVCKYFGENR